MQANTFVLVIDPGHGGKDPGALGKRGKEKDINLAVGLLAGKYIADEHPDVKIVYTRTKDVFIGLDERADIANKANANLFISIHANSLTGNSSIKGAEVYTFGVTRNAENLEVAKRENSVIRLEDNYKQKYEGYDPNSSESNIIFEFMVNLYADQSIHFASMVQNELVKTADRDDRGVKQAGYLVLRKSSLPRILIELDYISNSDAAKYLSSQEGQKKLARSIANAFTRYKNDFDIIENKPPVREIKPLKESKDEQQAPTIPDTVQLPEQEKQLSKQEEQLPEKTIKKENTEKTTSSDIVYKIQILAATKKIPANSKELKGYKATYYVEGNYYKYTVGESRDWNEINKLREKIVKDFKDAFIITLKNGVKVPNK